jgi:hypothetical protein
MKFFITGCAQLPPFDRLSVRLRMNRIVGRPADSAKGRKKWRLSATAFRFSAGQIDGPEILVIFITL